MGVFRLKPATGYDISPVTRGSVPIVGLVHVTSPAVLPSFARCFTVVSTPDTDWGALDVPEGLRAAVPSRRREFLAGRYCVARAMELLDPTGSHPPVGRQSDGNPEWPDGVTGSVTHTGTFAWAAVAFASDARGIGIDSERLRRFDDPARLARHIMRPDEAAVGGPELDDRLRLPLVFSAKEAIFKCLYPLVGRRFYFEDAAIEDIDMTAGTFRARPASALAPGVGPGLRIEGQFAFESDHVHTAVWLPAAVGFGL